MDVSLIEALLGGAFVLFATLAGGRMARSAALDAIREQSRSDRELQAQTAADDRRRLAEQMSHERALQTHQRRVDAAHRLLVALTSVRDMLAASEDQVAAAAAHRTLRASIVTDGILLDERDLVLRLQQVAMICFEWAGNGSGPRMAYHEFDHYCAYVFDSFDLWLREDPLPAFQPVPQPGIIKYYDSVDHAWHLRAGPHQDLAD